MMVMSAFNWLVQGWRCILGGSGGIIRENKCGREREREREREGRYHNNFSSCTQHGAFLLVATNQSQPSYGYLYTHTHISLSLSIYIYTYIHQLFRFKRRLTQNCVPKNFATHLPWYPSLENSHHPHFPKQINNYVKYLKSHRWFPPPSRRPPRDNW